MDKVDRITSKIDRCENGSIFFVTDFAEDGNDKYISRLLSKDLVARGTLMKIANGIYFKPEATRFGVLQPSIDKVAHAIAKRDGAQILPTGDTALYQLGFSTQIPMRHIYLTSGSDRLITIDNHTLTLLHRTPKNFSYNNMVMAVLVQALRSVGNDRITDADKARTKELLRTIIAEGDYEHDIMLPPVWIKKMLVGLKKEIDNEQ